MRVSSVACAIVLALSLVCATAQADTLCVITINQSVSVGDTFSCQNCLCMEFRFFSV